MSTSSRRSECARGGRKRNLSDFPKMGVANFYKSPAQISATPILKTKGGPLWRCFMSATMLLLVDDSPTVLQLRTARLQGLGFSVSTATSAVSAIAFLERTPVAAVLLEYKPEGLDAEAVAFHIKQRFPATPIILLSAFCDLPERILWLVDEYVMRSEPLERIAAVVNQLARPADRLGVQSEKLLKRSQAAG